MVLDLKNGIVKEYYRDVGAKNVKNFGMKDFFNSMKEHTASHTLECSKIPGFLHFQEHDYSLYPCTFLFCYTFCFAPKNSRNRKKINKYMQYIYLRMFFACAYVYACMLFSSFRKSHLHLFKKT